MSAELPTVSFQIESGVAEKEPWTVVGSAELSNTVPWRTFRWYKGQRHYSGLYWSATMRDHVVYESRLELSRLIFADFDQAVHRILAQPFLVKAKVDGRIRKVAALKDNINGPTGARFRR
jgi:Zn-finger domain-containing protein